LNKRDICPRIQKEKQQYVRFTMYSQNCLTIHCSDTIISTRVNRYITAVYTQQMRVITLHIVRCML